MNKTEKLADGSYDLQDCTELRKNSPKIYGLSVNDEILFLLSVPKPFYEGKSGYKRLSTSIPKGYEDTGCLVIPRKNREMFRNFFFRTFEEFKYEISSLADFLKLNRAYSFDIKGNLMQSTDWAEKMVDFEYFHENENKLILIPKVWATECKVFKTIEARQNAIEEGK
jgi:hypothetical protein